MKFKILIVILFLTLFSKTRIGVSHAAQYYMSPSGSDSNSGTYTSPWKTINKANSVVTSGDTIIFKDGVYDLYDPVGKTVPQQLITKSGTTWKAENKHKAVLDGGMGPELFAANPQNAGAIYRAKMPHVIKDEFYINMIYLLGVSNVTIDGLVIANSPGRGLVIYQDTADKTVENITIKNVWFDFNWENSFLVQSKSKADYSKVRNITYENGLNTRGARMMLCFQNDKAFCSNWPGPHRPSGSSNIVTRNSVFAYGYGEIGPDHGATFDLFENNVVIHSYISYYFDTVQNVTLRNNLMVASDSLRTGGTPGLWHQPAGATSTRESHNQGVPDSFANKNIHIYNNVFVGLGVGLYGDFKGVFYPTEGTYIGHNTFIGTNQTRNWSGDTGSFFDVSGYSSQNPIRGIVENNLLIPEQMTAKQNMIDINSSGWEMVGRNNLVPQSQASSLLHTSDAIKSDSSGVVNPNEVFYLSTPSMFVHRDVFKTKVEQDVAYSREYVKNVHLKSTSQAINAGSTAGAAQGVTPPTGARTRDYYGNSRDSKPDIGAIEYGGDDDPRDTTRTSLTILLHGIGNGGDNVNALSKGNMNPLRPVITVNFELFNSNNQSMGINQSTVTYNLTTGVFTGIIDLGTLPTGVYTGIISSPGYLRKSYPGILSITNNQINNLPPLALITGDSNRDNKLSILDYNIIFDCISELNPPRSCNDANKKLSADLTDDGMVNQFDYNLLLRELSVQVSE